MRQHSLGHDAVWKSYLADDESRWLWLSSVGLMKIGGQGTRRPHPAPWQHLYSMKRHPASLTGE